MKRSTLIKKNNNQQSEILLKRNLYCEVQMEVHKTSEMGNDLHLTNRLIEEVD